MTDPAATTTRRLADRYWVLAHDGVPLRPLIGTDALRLGTAAALLAELVLDEAIVLEPTVRLREQPAGGGDRLCGHLRNAIAAEPDHAVRVWLRYLAISSVGTIRARLLLDGMLEETVTQVGRLRPVSCPTWQLTSTLRMDVAREVHTATRLPGPVLGGSGVITVPSYVELATLAGIAQATNLIGNVTRPKRGQIEDWTQRLPNRLPVLIRTLAALFDEAATR